MGNTVGGAGGPSTTGYVPTGDEVVGSPPPGGGGAVRGRDLNDVEGMLNRGTAVIPDGVDTTARPGAADAGGGTATTGGALAAPSTPRRLQDIAARAGDTSATGGDAGGIQSFGDFLLAILEFFAEIFSFGQYDSRLFNDYTSGDRARITEGGRAAARGIYEGGNGAQLDQFIVRSGTPPTPEMQGNPPLVRVRPELRAAVEAEVRQAFTTGTPPRLGISEQALRLRVDSMMRGIREEMTARVNGHTTAPGGGTAPTAAPTGPAAPPAREPVDLPRTTTITTATRTPERIGLAGADTRAEVDRELRGRFPSNAQMDELSGSTFGGVQAVPTRAQAGTIRDNYAAMNAAIARGDYQEATRLATALGMPFPRTESGHIDIDNLSEQQYQTLVALGAATYNSETGLSITNPNTFTSAIEGPAFYAALINDMAERGVSPLSAPPTPEMIRQYYTNVATETAHLSPADQQTAMREANQRVMDGMQVHYRGAGGRDPDYGALPTVYFAVDTSGRIMTDDNGRPLEFPSASAAREASPARHAYTIPSHGPHGMGDVTGRRTYGDRFESDCEGMASFRLRTLPPGWTAVGVVSGGPATGSIGHVVSLVRAPDGTVYISSNGKDLIPVQDRNGDGRLSGDEIRRAVQDEFRAIYRNGEGIGDMDAAFHWGIGTPHGEAPTGTDAAEFRADQLMADAIRNQDLQANAADPNATGANRIAVDPPNWDALATAANPPPAS